MCASMVKKPTENRNIFHQRKQSVNYHLPPENRTISTHEDNLSTVIYHLSTILPSPCPSVPPCLCGSKTPPENRNIFNQRKQSVNCHLPTVNYSSCHLPTVNPSSGTPVNCHLPSVNYSSLPLWFKKALSLLPSALSLQR